MEPPITGSQVPEEPAMTDPRGPESSAASDQEVMWRALWRDPYVWLAGGLALALLALRYLPFPTAGARDSDALSFGPVLLLVLLVLASRERAVQGRLRRDAEQAARRIHAALERKVATLEAHSALLTTAIEQAPVSVVITDSEGRIEYVNPAFTRITCYQAEEALGSTPRLLKSGEQDAAFYRRLWTTILAGREWRGEVANRRKDGTLYTQRLLIAPVRDREGGLLGFVGIGEDVSERKRAEDELRATEQRYSGLVENVNDAMLQAQKLEGIGRLAGGVAHDFNNILAVIMGFGELIGDNLEEHHVVRPWLQQVITAADRAADLTRQLLAFSRKQVMQRKPLDLNAVVRTLETMLTRLVGEDVEIEVRTGSDLGMVMADPAQLEQVMINLAVNARDAMPLGGRLTIETASAEFDEEYAAAHPPSAPGRFVMVAVSDTGIGMDAETQKRIFEPFFTTKPVGQGTGLGLATVYGIVKQSGGYIWAYSEVGRGTTFKVYLPRVEVEELGEADEAGVSVMAVPGGHETVLVVDDTESLRGLIRRLLEDRGYTVLTAPDGEEALSLVQERQLPIALLLTDVVMPKLGGRDLAKRLLALRPETRVLFMSGYTAGAVSHQGILPVGTLILEKPFNGAKLARAVRDALDRPTTS
jgi:PAS domain S-box-containing protein